MNIIKLITLAILSLTIAGCGSSDSSSGSQERPLTKIVAFGDSIGDPNFGITSPWPSRVSDIFGVEVSNYSRASASTDDFVNRVGVVLDAEQPSHLFILLGTNDAREGRVTSAVANLQFMVNEAEARNITVVVGTVPPNYRHLSDMDRAERISEGIRNLSDAKVAEVRGALGNDESLFYDGLHPGPAGQAIIADTMAGSL